MEIWKLTIKDTTGIPKEELFEKFNSVVEWIALFDKNYTEDNLESILIESIILK